MLKCVLLVEDDPALANAIIQGLQDEKIECKWSDSLASARQAVETDKPEAIILDLMLGNENGLDLLNELRANRQPTPVLILTALGLLENRVEGLNAGADDYLVKPFQMPELLARLVAITRRSRRIEGSTLLYGPLRLEVTTRRLYRDGKELVLSPTELSLLELFMRHSEQIMTRQMLCEQLWDSSWEGETNVIEVHINRLRGKVDKGFEKPLIHTVRGRGYVLSDKQT